MPTTRKPDAAADEAAQALQEASHDIQAEETEFIDYAVTAANGLRLRAEPSNDASVVAVLPCGVGVLGNTRPAENGWRQVFTGRLFGWVMEKFLEPMKLTEPDDDAE